LIRIGPVVRPRSALRSRCSRSCALVAREPRDHTEVEDNLGGTSCAAGGLQPPGTPGLVGSGPGRYTDPSLPPPQAALESSGGSGAGLAGDARERAAMWSIAA